MGSQNTQRIKLSEFIQKKDIFWKCKVTVVFHEERMNPHLLYKNVGNE